MESPAILVNVLLATVGLWLVFWILYRIALWARRRTSGAYVLGAFLIPIGGMGNVSDPDYKIVNEAKQIKRHKEDDTGDPPTDGADKLTTDPARNPGKNPITVRSRIPKMQRRAV